MTSDSQNTCTASTAPRGLAPATDSPLLPNGRVQASEVINGDWTSDGSLHLQQDTIARLEQPFLSSGSRLVFTTLNTSIEGADSAYGVQGMLKGRGI